MNKLNDQDIIELIKKLVEFEVIEEEESSKAYDILEFNVPGISDIIILSKELPSPEEILRLAREQNKPILL